MLVDRSRLFFEGGIVFDKGLHVLNRLDFLADLFLLGELFHELFDVLPNLAKVEVEIVGVEVVTLQRQHQPLQLGGDALRQGSKSLVHKQLFQLANHS